MAVKRRKSSGVDVAAVAARASRDARGVPAELLDGYLDVLASISVSGQRIGEDQKRLRHDIGGRAAELGVALRDLIDLYLTATWLAWPSLPGVCEATGSDGFKAVGEAVFRAADATVVELAEGYEQAQRWSVRQEESFRREFVDDLLDGRNLGQLPERAERYGLRLAASHVVAVVSSPEPFIDGGGVARQVETALHHRLGSRDVLVTTKDSLLVCVVPETLAGAADEFVRQVGTAVADGTGWRAGIGRAQSGPGGAVRSFEQAKNAVGTAGLLGLPGRVHRAADLLVYQVLLRDSAALAELVSVVLEPLRVARSGARPLLDTLSAYFASGRVATATARELNIGVRTVTYRLHRVKALTGYSADDPEQGFALHVAVLGAKLLGWPSLPGTGKEGAP
ncbi:PucR family transcriptional regulator [Umezawaea endophytica]|uniref:Helix-turn-helix domain-containing protein n=1 Tax=Umezawaea endophytica TaxID=1654476 RepID=A0A9X3A2Y7_9PSEU|nr:helix-turn-helix domain-containing protein [Umezawaea endophytica]MCS7481154.1 helix-turn-helix domain-containing protein [Umezawaea endophytica]